MAPLNIDLDEIRHDRFVIHNDKVRPLLRGEGVTVGKFFDLVTWRRDGLIARIRERGFNVRTIADRIALLPAIGPVPPLGASGVRTLAQAKERIATFDRDTLRWRDLPLEEHAGRSAVRIPSQAALRRRRGRGAGDYYIAVLSHDGNINLLPAGEADALLHAYAQIAQSDAPIVLPLLAHEDTRTVAQRQIVLPPPHLAALTLLTLDKAPPWTFPAAAAPRAAEIFRKLGITLQPDA